MGSFQNLTGCRFGKLTVLRRVEDYISPKGYRTARWLCRCDCGREKVMLRNVIKNAFSCGCTRKREPANNYEDLTGSKFGRWLVLGRGAFPPEEYREGNEKWWLCRCECGKERMVRRAALLSGRSTSCGCKRTETALRQICPEGQNSFGRYKGTAICQVRPRKLNSNNKSGVRGVYFSKKENCYIAKIGIQGKTITLGRFANLTDAAKARKAAEDKYFAPLLHEFSTECAGGSRSGVSC